MRRIVLISLGLLLSGGLTAYAINRQTTPLEAPQADLPSSYGQLPDSVRMALLNDRSTQSTEVSRILGEINTAQMLGFMYGGWRPTFEALDLNPQADGYRFRMQQQAPGIVTWAEPTVAHYRAFVAAVAADGDRLREIRCVSVRNAPVTLAVPRMVEGQLQCPSGSQRVS